jgi:hypothetical protein
MSASSNTIKGALPPASMDILLNHWCSRKGNEKARTHFLSVDAAMPYNSFATGVDPVNVTFLTILFSHISLPTSFMFLSVVTILMTPSGTPARLANYGM